MTHNFTLYNASTIAQGITEFAINGVGAISSASELADRFRKCPNYDTTDDAVQALVRWQTAHNFGTGFITGVGGLPSMPITIPASLASSWCIQARMSAAIADLYDYDIRDSRVQTFLFLSLLGDRAREVASNFGIELSKQLTRIAIQKIPGRVLKEINKRVCFRLITKGGERGLINLTKIVPVVGGVTGGAIDATYCYAVGRTARKIFQPK